MKFQLYKSFFWILIIPLVMLVSCSDDPEFKFENESIILKWNQGYEEETREITLKGLAWAFSYIGATETNCLNDIVWEANYLKVNVNQLGLTKGALQKLNILNYKLKLSEEYSVNKGIDIGRYITLLIGTSEHYYALVEMPDTYDKLIAEYELQELAGHINNSSITGKYRILKYSSPETGSQMFVSEEIEPTTGELLEFETLDIMPNGQPRFGLFSKNGDRINGANEESTAAGKPAKCMWCHESKIQPLFNEQDNFPGYLAYEQLKDSLIFFQTQLFNFQKAHTNGVDFTDLQEHQYMELLYISFMEPSGARLSLEWGITLNEVENKLSGESTHVYSAYPFLGDLYYRESVEAYAPYASLSVTNNVRESFGKGINHMN